MLEQGDGADSNKEDPASPRWLRNRMLATQRIPSTAAAIPPEERSVEVLGIVGTLLVENDNEFQSNPQRQEQNRSTKGIVELSQLRIRQHILVATVWLASHLEDHPRRCLKPLTVFCGRCCRIE